MSLGNGKKCESDHCKQKAVPSERYCGHCRGLILENIRKEYENDESGWTSKTHLKSIFEAANPDDVVQNDLGKIKRSKLPAEYRNRQERMAIKNMVWQNSLTLKFTGQTLAEQAKKAKKFSSNVRFIKLCNGYPIKRIRSLRGYRKTLLRALSVDVEHRASNYAYIKLLDIELERFEKLRPDECKAIYESVCNELEAESNKNQTE